MPSDSGSKRCQHMWDSSLPARAEPAPPARAARRSASASGSLRVRMRCRRAHGAPAASCQRNARGAAGALGRDWQALPLQGFYHRELALMSPTDCADCAVPVPPATSSRLESDSEAFGFGGRTK